MVAEYDIHRKSYKYGSEDWQLLVNILHDYSDKLMSLSHKLAKEENLYKFRRITSPLTELLLTTLIVIVILFGGVYSLISVNIKNDISQAIAIIIATLSAAATIAVLLFTLMSISRREKLILKHIEKDARVLSSRLESALRLTISVADQVEISLAKKLEMDLYIDESSSALEYYHLISDSKTKYKSAKYKEIIEPFSDAIGRLESKSMKTRLSGIHDLEQISIDLPDKYYTVTLETVCAFIRDRRSVDNTSMDIRIKKDKSIMHLMKSIDFFYSDIPEDIKFALNVIRRRNKLQENTAIKIDLRRVNLAGAELMGFDFRYANLRDCNFRRANLQGIDFSHADLRGVDFSEAIIRDSDFSKADLNGANFSSARLITDDFIGANLNAINFSRTYFKNVHIDKDVKGIYLNDVQREQLFAW
jgi:Pentapeptide repeats (9 copies)